MDSFSNIRFSASQIKYPSINALPYFLQLILGQDKQI